MKSVLIADDSPSLRLLVQTALQSDAYEMIAAEDGNEAWRLLKHHRPAVALLDVMMPGQSGLELTRAIRQDPELMSTRVILLTAKSKPADIEAGMVAGADLYLTKPFSPLELVTAVEKALGLPTLEIARSRSDGASGAVS